MAGWTKDLCRSPDDVDDDLDPDARVYAPIELRAQTNKTRLRIVNTRSFMSFMLFT